MDNRELQHMQAQMAKMAQQGGTGPTFNFGAYASVSVRRDTRSLVLELITERQIRDTYKSLGLRTTRAMDERITTLESAAKLAHQAEILDELERARAQVKELRTREAKSNELLERIAELERDLKL